MNADIDLGIGITLGQGWHDIERSDHDGRTFRWTSLVSSLLVAHDRRDQDLLVYAGSPGGQGVRHIAVSGPQGSVRRTIRAGWHWYAFPAGEILDPSPQRQSAVSIELSTPVRVPDESRTLGVMVTDVAVGHKEGAIGSGASAEPADICVSPALSLGDGWYDLERAEGVNRFFRWTSTRCGLQIEPDSAQLDEAAVVFHICGPPDQKPREVAVTGPRGTVRRTIRPGWDYYPFPVHELGREPSAPTTTLWMEVSAPFHAPGDSRTLGVMVDQAMIEDGGRHLPFILVDGLVASVKTYDINGIGLRICDYAESTGSDIVVAELREDQYQLESIDFQPGDVVIDIGAHVGIFSTYLAKRYPFLRILAFEPIPVSYRMCRKNVELNDTPNVCLYHVAVTSDRRELDLVVHLQGNSGGATANLGNMDLAGHARFQCASLTLDDILESFLVDSCKLLKIDCEGSEHEILLSARGLHRVHYLRGEFHINRHLESQGYSIERLRRHCKAALRPGRVVVTTCRMFE